MRHPIAHRAAGHRLDTVEPPADFELPTACVENTVRVDTMQDGTDPAAIVVSRRTLGWAGAALFALFSGGQIASVRLADDGPDPTTAALSARVDQLSIKMDQLSADGEKRDVHFNTVLNAVLIYFLESERYQRETRQPGSPPRSEELEKASQRLRELASR